MNGGQPCVGNDTETARACYTPCPGQSAIIYTEKEKNGLYVDLFASSEPSSLQAQQHFKSFLLLLSGGSCFLVARENVKRMFTNNAHMNVWNLWKRVDIIIIIMK